ncbi:putative membrane protein [Saccharothrix espanaensis DSM 44229]|uniref:Putative membrane protein n=1 Tax=Saccharothrix espanaensis (strain ATCC 51144 / DSM 44229 / JCM 9112 / NBRC 15066 / NRRL 15764) TaxID=1179773 RepID=K0JS85_SACES|nr:putative membrane protein [Saccharothrix espanaensis DSM 44229]
MTRVSVRGGRSSSRRVHATVWKLPNGTRCVRCHRFGMYTRRERVCCSCLGFLPLVFDAPVVIPQGGGVW